MKINKFAAVLAVMGSGAALTACGGSQANAPATEVPGAEGKPANGSCAAKGSCGANKGEKKEGEASCGANKPAGDGASTSCGAKPAPQAAATPAETAVPAMAPAAVPAIATASASVVPVAAKPAPVAKKTSKKAGAQGGCGEGGCG